MEKYRITTEQTEFELDTIHGYLTQSYWAKGITKQTVQRSIENSLCFAVIKNTEELVGFARVITDKATFAYLADVFIVEEEQGQGLGKKLISFILAHPELQGLRRFALATKDAHGLYSQFGFQPIGKPENLMQIC